MSEEKNRQRLLKNRFVLKLSRALFRLALPLLGGIKILGAENIPKSGAVLICPNHTSDLDPVVICAATDRPDLNALAKSELFKVPILGTYFHLMGATPVVRDSADRAALRTAESILVAGRMLLIFPEGRISENGELASLQLGAILLSQKTCTPVVPVGIIGSRNILPYGKTFPRYAKGGVVVNFGKPIDPAKYEALPHRLAQRTMSNDVRSAITELSADR